MKPLLLIIGLLTAVQGFSQQELDSLVKELNRHPAEDTTRYFLLKRIAYLYSFTDALKGVDAADAAIALAKKLNSDAKIAGGYSNKATNLHKLGRDSEALALYKIAVNMHLNAGNKKSAANTYFNMGYVYFDVGNYSMAINYQLKSLELFTALNLVSDAADAYNSIGSNYMRLDDYSSALKNFFKALNIYQQLHQPESEALVLSNIGMTYHALSDAAKALDYYQKALQLNNKTGNKKNLAHDYQHIGVIYDDAGDLDKA